MCSIVCLCVVDSLFVCLYVSVVCGCVCLYVVVRVLIWLVVRVFACSVVVCL